MTSKLALALVSAAVVGLAGWVYATGNRVTAVEVRVDERSAALDRRLENIERSISNVEQDVKRLLSR